MIRLRLMKCSLQQNKENGAKHSNNRSSASILFKITTKIKTKTTPQRTHLLDDLGHSEVQGALEGLCSVVSYARAATNRRTSSEDMIARENRREQKMRNILLMTELIVVGGVVAAGALLGWSYVWSTNSDISRLQVRIFQCLGAHDSLVLISSSICVKNNALFRVTSRRIADA